MSSRVQINPAARGGTRRSSKEGQPARKGRQSKESQGVKPRKLRASKEAAEWNVADKWAPPRRLTTPELGAARRMFFSLDQDGSGSIDEEEITVMLRNLGQEPTEEEVRDLIKSVDGGPHGDGDGKIQLREFIQLYGRGLDSKTTVDSSEANDCYSAFGGSKDALVSPRMLHDRVLEEYDLDIDLGYTFGLSKPELTKDDIDSLLHSRSSAPPSRMAARAERA